MKQLFSSIFMIPTSYVEFWLLVFLFLSFPFSTFSQKLSIEEFTSEPFDLSSRTKQVKDNNNLSCALIKIVCNDEITGVQGSVVNAEEYDNEYWVYLPNGTKYIKVLTRHHPPLDFKISDYLTSGVVSQSTYQLNLKSNLPPEILYGSSNPLAPVTMANDTDPLLPRWWNIHEDGMYVGISLPTLDGESAKIAAVTNALYSFLHSKGCYISYMAEIEIKNEHVASEECISQEISRAVSKGFKKGFAISILQEYYNSKGEYFVLCAIKSDVKSSNAMMIDWYFQDANSEGSLSVNIDVKTKINRFPLEGSMQFEVSWSPNSQKYNLSCKGKVFMHNKTIENNDHISDFILSGDVGLTQLRLLTTFPLLTDTISFKSASMISDDSSFSTTSISGEGKSIPVNINLTDSDLKGSYFSVTESFPMIPFNDSHNSNNYVTGLSKKYYRTYADSKGNATAAESDGYCHHRLFEVSKNKALLQALSIGLSSMFSEIKYSFDSKTESISSKPTDLNNYSGVTTSKAVIYPLYYLDANERVDCKDKKYRKYWNEAKYNYPNMASVIIPIEPIKDLNDLK